VHDPSFGSQTIFRPDLLDMNQGALPGAKGEVLQSGKHDEIIFLVQD